jgi:flagellar basal-body rod protein FlgG
MKSLRFRPMLAIISAIVIGIHGRFVSAVEQSSPQHKPIESKPSDRVTKRPPQSSPDREPQATRDLGGCATLRTALKNYEYALEVIANNIANADTPGFKKSRVHFEDCAYRQMTLPGAEDASGNCSSAGVSIGSGSRIAATEIDFRQGKLKRTGRQLDLAIDGRGFFQVRDPSGRLLFCRGGHFALNSNGRIVLQSAHSSRPLEPAIVVSGDATSIAISARGVVSCRFGGADRAAKAATIQMADFINPGGLVKIGENLYEESDGSGVCRVGRAGKDFGTIRQGWTERSNVDKRQEMAEWKRISNSCRSFRQLLREDAGVKADSTENRTAFRLDGYRLLDRGIVQKELGLTDQQRANLRDVSSQAAKLTYADFDRQ